MRPFQFAPLFSLVSLSYAWPWPPSFAGNLKDGVQELEHLFRRQDGAQPGSTSNSGTPRTTTVGTTTITGSATVTTGSITGTAAQSTGMFIGNGTASFDPRDPAGGISMITPNVMSGAQYYKIGDWIHFAWNYTSLQATPTAINVVASCSLNQAVYTIASNQSIEPTGQIYWDTGSYQETALNRLVTNQYTLIIWDADKPMTAAPQAGYLGAYSQFTFGMYEKQPYSNLSDFNCPTCNGAASLERMTLNFLLGMVGITVLSFTWFVTNLSVL